MFRSIPMLGLGLFLLVGCGSSPLIVSLERPFGSVRTSFFGVCVSEKKLLTVAHAFSSVDPLEIRRNTEEDLVLLSWDACDRGVTLSNEDFGARTALFSCEDGESLGEVLSEGSLLATDLFGKQSGMENALLTSISGAQGMSGTPLCDREGKLVSIVGALHEGKAVLISPLAVQSFLGSAL